MVELAEPGLPVAQFGGPEFALGVLSPKGKKVRLSPHAFHAASTICDSPFPHDCHGQLHVHPS